MARRRRGAPSDGTTEPTSEEQPAGAEPQTTLTMRGTADQVKRQLGVDVDLKPDAEKPENGNGHDDEKKKFVEALRNPKYIIRVKRTTPREHNGQKTNVEVWQAELPLSYKEIQEEIAKTAMGGKYRVAVVDPNSNNTVAADTFEVDGEPFVPESDLTQEEQDRIFMQGKPKTQTEISVEALERRAAVSAKLLEVESIEAQLEDARKRRENVSKPAPQDDSRIADLDRRLVEAKHQAELEARDRRHAEEMRELKALIAQNSKPAKPEGQSEITLMLQQMRDAQAASDKRFEALQKQMQDDKMSTLLEEVKSIKNKPQQNNMLEMAETMLKLNKMIAGVRGDDDDDDDDDADDDRPWWERALDKLGGKFGDKLLEKFTSMEEKGEKVDREKFMAEMSQYADQVAMEAAAKQKVPALPPPSAPKQPVLPPPPIVPAAVTSLPPPPPAAAVAVPPPPTAPAPEVPAKLSVEQEIAYRTLGILEMIEREVELRPNEYHWNYEGCFLLAPESVLEKVCAAPDPVSMMDAFSVPGINPDGIVKMKEKIAGNPRIMAWLKAGQEELKGWWTAKQADPTFDPFEDEETGEEG